MGPEIFAIIFVVCMYLGWKGAAYIDYKRGIDAPDKPEELEAPLACEALVTRVFEQRLVDAGIMEVIDMTTCDTPVGLCKDCAPTHKARIEAEKCAVGECQAKGTDRWNENEMLCKSHWDMRKQQEATRRELRPARRGAAGRSRYDRKTLKVGGRDINWPSDVPEYANYVVKYDTTAMCDRVVFRWTNPQDGKQLWRTMLVPDFSYAEAVYSDQHEKPVLTLPVLGSAERERRRAAGHYSRPPVPRTRLQIEYIRAQQKRKRIEEKQERRKQAIRALTKKRPSKGYS